MAEKKMARASAKTKSGSASGRKPTKTKRASAGKKSAASAPGLDLRTSTNQLGAILNKVLELADAGVTLGVNVVSLLRSVAQSRFLEGRVPGGEEAYSYGGPGDAPVGSQAAAAPPAAGAGAPAQQAPPRRYCVINRAPVAPGAAVRVSFSINNDLPQAVRKLSVSARDFVGAVHGFKLADGILSVEPHQAKIAPLDFEKFVLKGKLPQETPEDSYNGWIVVEGDESVKIPAVLVVARRA